jgi:hypothetical protein
LHHHPYRADDKTFTALTAVHVANALEYEGLSETDGLPLPVLDADYLKQLGLEERVQLWRNARSDPEGTTIESRAQRAKASVTTMETKAQRAKAAAKAAAKPADSAPAPVPQANKFTPAESALGPIAFRGAWKWLAIGLGALAAMVMLARLEIMRLQSSEEKPEVQKVAEKPLTPVKNEVAAVVAPAKPVAETKPASVPATNAALVAAAQPASTPAPTPTTALPKTALDKLKLQAIFYSSEHPSALISGQLASVDEEVAQCRVLDISPSTVTVEYLHQRRTLTLR